MSWTATRDGGWSPGSQGRWGRAGWHPLELAAMVAGFVFFWPVGLAILAWKGVRSGWFARGGCSRSERRAAGPGVGWNGGWGGGELRRDSGNSAFEDYKEQELARLQAEFDRLVHEQRAFGDFLETLRRAKDKAEFDQFLASRRAAGEGPQQA